MCICREYAEYMQCLCSVYAVFMQCLCSVYAVFMQCLCSVYAVFMQCLCSVYAVFMQCLCSVYAVYMQCILPYNLPYYRKSRYHVQTIPPHSILLHISTFPRSASMQIVRIFSLSHFIVCAHPFHRSTPSQTPRLHLTGISSTPTSHIIRTLSISSPFHSSFPPHICRLSISLLYHLFRN